MKITTTSTNSSNFNINYNKETGTLSGGCVPTGTNAEPNYYEYCWYRLPCGICTRTNEFCPFSGNSIHVDWNTPTCTQSKDDVWYVDLDSQRFSTFSDKVERALKEVQE